MPHSALFLILRRMRAPLITLIVCYAIALLGMTLIPGVDANGRPTAPMSFFHAFYFVSYTATTIGFGEVPATFSDAQRAWATFTIYLTVIAWLYGIGTILALLREPAMQRALRASRFARRVRRLRRPFHIVAGCGETGMLLLHALDAREHQCVAIDIDGERVAELDMAEFRQDIPVLAADARLSESLILAGLRHRRCAGVIALTNDDQANLAAAVTVKLLRPELPVMCRADTLDTAANMASFGTEEVVIAFELFAEHLAMAINNPGQHLLYRWLTGVPGEPLPQPLEPPTGDWIVCGYGRFGKAVARHLRQAGVRITVIEARPDATGCDDCIVGRGTEAATLIDAGIERAVGIVAGTDDDVNNLSIVMTARQLNPELFMVARQNRHANGELFARFAAEITMQPAGIVAREYLSLLTTPLLARFLAHTRTHDDAWADELISRIAAVVNDSVPEVWDTEIGRRRGEAIWQAARDNQAVCLRDLLRDPVARDVPLPCVPLLLEREHEALLLPEEDVGLRNGDRLLFCGTPPARRRQALVLHDYNALAYVLSGRDSPGGTLWRWWAQRSDTRRPGASNAD